MYGSRRLLKTMTFPHRHGAPPIQLESGEVGDEPLPTLASGFAIQKLSEPVTVFSLTCPINMSLILCRIYANATN